MYTREAVQEHPQSSRRVDVFLTMRRDEEVLPRLQAEALDGIRCIDLRPEMLENFAHGRPCHEDPARMQTLAQKVPSRVLRVDKVEVCHVVDDSFPLGSFHRNTGCLPSCDRRGSASLSR